MGSAAAVEAVQAELATQSAALEQRSVEAARRVPGVSGVYVVTDDERIAAFLETSSERNVCFYRRLGFDVVGETLIQGGPPVWAMLRRPVRQP